MKPLRCFAGVFFLVLALSFSAHALLPVGTWDSSKDPSDFPAGTWEERLWGLGEGKEGNEITALSTGFYTFEGALLSGLPKSIDNSSCGPGAIAKFETTYVKGTLTLITNNPSSPWFINESAAPYIIDLENTTVWTCKYATYEISFELASEGKFGSLPFIDYGVLVTADFSKAQPITGTYSDGVNRPTSTIAGKLTSAQITITGPTPAAVDIKPGSCPNPINVKSRGVIPMAILGGQKFDVRTINNDNENKVFLTNGVSINGNLIKVSPLRMAHEYVGTPFINPLLPKNDRLDCSNLGGDGFLDLTLKFDTQKVVEAFGLLDAEDRSTQEWFLMFEMENNGTKMVGSDVVWILNRTQNGNKGNHYGRIKHRGY